MFIHRLSKVCPIVDLVLVLLDGGSWDLETSYELINNVIINTLKKSGEGRTDRLLVAINQCDMVMKGWNLGCGSRPSERRLGKLFGGESVFETYMPSETIFRFVEERLIRCDDWMQAF